MIWLGLAVLTGWPGAHAFFSFALLGALAFHAIAGAPFQEIAAGALGGLGLGAVAAHYSPGPHGPIEFFGFIGLGSLAILTLKGYRSAAALNNFYAAAILPIGAICSTYLLKLTIIACPLTYDLLLYAFDDSLGMPLAAAAGRLFAANLPLKVISSLIYFAVPLPIAVLYALQRRKRLRPPAPVALVFIAIAAAGSLLYFLYPAAGPIYLFPTQFPAALPRASTLSIHPANLPPVARNAMPSLHAAWALILVWNARGAPRWMRIVAFVFAAFTLLATVGLGEHYFIDLVVTIPFAVAIQAACTTAVPFQAARRNAVLGGAIMTAGWLILLRFGIPLFQRSAAFGWSLIAVTVAVSLALKRATQTGYR